MENNQPLWYIAFTAAGMGLLKLLDVLKVGDLLKGKAKADKDCAKEVARLKFLVVKQNATLKLLASFLNNPENVELTKESIEAHLKEISPVIDEIEKENTISKNE
jgi:pyruvate kinase